MVDRDPRDIITPYAFRVDSTLLGVPLAGPWRRAGAMAVDGFFVAILANAPGVLLAAAAALVLFRASSRRSSAGYLRRSLRLMTRAAGAFMLFVFVIVGWNKVSGWFDDDEPATDVAAGEAEGGTMDGIAGLQALGSVVAFQTAEDEDEAVVAALALASSLRKAGTEPEAVQEVLRDLADDTDRPWLATAVDSVLGASLPAEAGGTTAAADASPATTEHAYAAAVIAGDSATVDSLRPLVATELHSAEVEDLRDEVDALERQNEQLVDEVAEARSEAENIGILAYLRALVDDLGVGFGWTGLYFTAFLALWNGQTPGKRLFGIRVLRLDGKLLGWWCAFERFGGYAASLATGMLGFFQIFWDANRQAIHDKIVHTVVAKDSASIRAAVSQRTNPAAHASAQ